MTTKNTIRIQKSVRVSSGKQCGERKHGRGVQFEKNVYTKRGLDSALLALGGVSSLRKCCSPVNFKCTMGRLSVLRHIDSFLSDDSVDDGRY
jgi:hypothetical protein